MSRSNKALRKTMRRCVKSCMKSHRVRIPKYDFPIRLRPWFLVFTSLVMILLAFLGFTNFLIHAPMVEILHFICLGVATGVFYFIWDVDDEARRIWIWRNSGLILTGIICFFFGGFISEVIQSLLPYKQFDFGDVIANLLGSMLGLWVSYHLERYYRHRREISRLYQPLSVDEEDLFSDSDPEEVSRGLHLLSTSTHRPSKSAASNTPVHVNHVWDESDALFDIGEEDEEETETETGGRQSDDTLRGTPGVKVVITPPH
ncbi:hypothetical protein BU17DRAFT_53464 [Hysterangium stoloniferum]|nr:hypothetical protein BU17DRAFT_53464 [Hysterangium stoloniferum]